MDAPCCLEEGASGPRPYRNQSPASPLWTLALCTRRCDTSLGTVHDQQYAVQLTVYTPASRAFRACYTLRFILLQSRSRRGLIGAMIASVWLMSPMRGCQNFRRCLDFADETPKPRPPLCLSLGDRSSGFLGRGHAAEKAHTRLLTQPALARQFATA